MNFANLVSKIPESGKIKLKGGQSQGHVLKTNEKLFAQKFTPSLGKGSEYAAKYRAEEEKKHFEALTSKLGSVRVDVTGEQGQSQLFEPEELTSIGTLPNVLELDRETLTQVYDNYVFNPVEHNKNLNSIHQEREQILSLIETNQVCIIKGPTGCGKSTQIPQFILDSCVKKRAHCNIIVTQPRRIAAITIAQHVCKERKWQVGTLVGYQVGLDKTANEETRLLYCTTGVLLEKLINTKHMTDYTHILLDEVHERDVDMDLLMLLVKYFLRSNSPNVKVVLMSATMDVTRFAMYYEIVLRDEKQPAPHYEIKQNQAYEVQVYYLEALKLGKLPDINADEPMISKEAYDLVPLMIRAFDSIDAKDYEQKLCLDEKGAVLIFLPGIFQIETLYERLHNEERKDPSKFKLWICPLHSSITKDEQEKVRQYAPPGLRKVILSTNIAESSITITDVKFVIDFCLTKHLVANPETGFTSLQLAWASHTNCIQREGRAGRVQNGRVYRMVTRKFYALEMPKESVVEMQRCPLQIVVLKCKKMMEEECPLRLLSNALDPPDLSNYEKTVLKLKEVGAMLTTSNGKYTPIDGDLTFMGRVMASLPLDIHVTKLILLGHIFDILEETIIMGCAMSVRNIFSEPFQQKIEAYNSRLLWADSSESDLIAYLNAYMVWRQLTGMGKFNRSVGSEKTWARRHMLQIKHLQEVAKQEQDIKRRLKFLNIQVVRQHNKPIWQQQEKSMILKLVLAGAFYPHYYIRCAQNPDAEGEAVKQLSGRSPYNSVFVRNMPQPVPLYFDQLKDCLKRNQVSETFEMFHDDTRKVIISFSAGNTPSEVVVGEKNLHMDIPGEIIMPVYRAIKMRQLNIPLLIKPLEQSAIKEKLNMLSLKSRNSMRSLVGMDQRPQQISAHDQFVEIDMVHFVDAGHFYAHILPKDKLHQVQSILATPGALVELSGDVVDDFVYAAPYRDQDDVQVFYYRARVQKKIIQQDNSKLWVEVYFIDYGNTSRCTAQDLREVSCEELQRELDSIPPLALECTLAEVQPDVWSVRGGLWSDSANAYVQKLLSRNSSWCAKIYSYINEVASMYLFLEDNRRPSDKEPLTLNTDLINKNFARHKEENYFSKLDNAKRCAIQEKGETSSLAGSETESCISNSFGGLDLFAMPTTNSRRTIELKGPTSPLEMKLYSMAQCSTQKEVKVDWNSVNSVLLDADPTDPHDRLLVAGSVSQSSDGRKLSLNHTTVLPNIHGLAALVCLIFAPSVELRTDDCFSRYTGALCGLGSNDKSVSLYPANDMEITFDVEFTINDLLNVNKLRYWLNERYCSVDADDYPEGKILDMQRYIRELTINLLKSKRRSVKVFLNSKQFLWDRIPEHHILSPLPPGLEDLSARFIFQFLRAGEIDDKNDRTDVDKLLNAYNNLQEMLSRNMSPRIFRCELCVADFDYCVQLQLHMKTSYHLELVKWLESRAVAHGLKILK